MEATLQKPNETKTTLVPDSPEQVEEYTKLLDSEFIKILPDGKADQKFAKFTYRISNFFPEYFGHGNDSEVIMKFQVQKFHKIDLTNPETYFVEQKETGGPIKKPNMVRGNVYNSATFRCNLVDADAERMVPCREFTKQYGFVE